MEAGLACQFLAEPIKRRGMTQTWVHQLPPGEGTWMPCRPRGPREEALLKRVIWVSRCNV